MQIFRHIPATLQTPCALAIGNFDGLHLGHQALLNKLIQVSKMQHLISAVITFEPHPREFFTPESAPTRLCSLREKLEHFSAAGVERVYVCRFNHSFAKLTAGEFMQNILRNALNTKTVLVGEDFRFGAKRAGSIKDFVQSGFNLISLPQVDSPKSNNEANRVSSTRLRMALAVGNFQEAFSLLGRPYSMSGKVVHGAKRGREIGYPTANVHMRHERPALSGVYAVKLDGLPSVANLGIRPTIEGVPKLMLEVHVLDFSADLYGQHVLVEFLHKIRDEIKFDSLNALKTQIGKDVAVARSFFATIE